jgi:protein ImuB
MQRVVSLYLPSWPTDRLRRTLGDAAPAPDIPLVLVGRYGGKRVVQAADTAARAAGLWIGMPVAKAQALAPGLTLRDADPVGDVAALERLAAWTLRYTPIAAADPPDGLALDTAGADHLWGGEAALLADMVARLSAAGIAARAAVAEHLGAAHALARTLARPTLVVPSGESCSTILDLPIAALRLPADIVEGLRALGFERIGELEAQPRAPLALRFGPEPGRRLDQAMGRLAEPITPLRPPDVPMAQRVYPEPIGAAETIARYTGKLVAELCTILEARGLGARRLDLLFYRVDARLAAVRVGTSQPVRDPRRLTRLLCDRLETVEPGFGIERMHLVATLVEPLRPKQEISSLAAEPEPHVSGLVDVLANRIGADRLYRITPVPSDVPERSAARVPALAPESGAGWPDHWPRPARLLPRPEPVETVALLPDHPPEVFTWRGVRRRVKRADGPERVFGEWWKRDVEWITVRDYFTVEDEAGERFWLFRAGDGEDPTTGSHQWFLHGVFG